MEEKEIKFKAKRMKISLEGHTEILAPYFLTRIFLQFTICLCSNKKK